jgi:hypothetical protein
VGEDRGVAGRGEPGGGWPAFALPRVPHDGRFAEGLVELALQHERDYGHAERRVPPDHDRITLPAPGRGKGRGQLPGDRGAVGGRVNGVHDLGAGARIVPGQPVD